MTKFKVMLFLEWIASVLMNIPILFMQWFVSRGTHKEMALDNIPPKGLKLVPYYLFKQYFSRVKWDKLQGYNSLKSGEWDYSKSNYIHADIFIVKGRGFLFTPIGLMLANRLKARKISDLEGSSSPKYGWIDDENTAVQAVKKIINE